MVGDVNLQWSRQYLGILHQDGCQNDLDRFGISGDGRARRTILAGHADAGTQKTRDIRSSQSYGGHSASRKRCISVGTDVTTVIGKGDGIFQ